MSRKADRRIERAREKVNARAAEIQRKKANGDWNKPLVGNSPESGAPWTDLPKTSSLGRSKASIERILRQLALERQKAEKKSAPKRSFDPPRDNSFASHPFYGISRSWEDVQYLFGMYDESEPDEILVAACVETTYPSELTHPDDDMWSGLPYFSGVAIWRNDCVFYAATSFGCRCEVHARTAPYGVSTQPDCVDIDPDKEPGHVGVLEFENVRDAKKWLINRHIRGNVWYQRWFSLVINRMDEPVPLPKDPPAMDTWVSRVTIDEQANKWRSDFPSVDIWKEHFTEVLPQLGVSPDAPVSEELTNKLTNKRTTP